MYGCFVTEPEDDGADLGVVFFHNAGYSTACGHGTIALVTWAIESGPSSRRRRAGRGRRALGAAAAVAQSRTAASPRCGSATCRRSSGRAGLQAAGRNVDIAFGGAFYASLAERVEPRRAAAADRARPCDQGRPRGDHEIVHPHEPELRDVYGVIFWQEEGEAPLTQRNVTVFADGEVDRSPCGSGTSARLALLHAEGRARERRAAPAPQHRRQRVHRPRRRSRRSPGAESSPRSRAAPTHGRHEFVLEPDDELGEGFLLR